MKIWFDMDGTIANFYGVENWLDMLLAENPCPYLAARPLVNMNVLARLIHKAQMMGIEVGIISWLSKSSTEKFDALVTSAKRRWLAKHLPSVTFDEINIVAYGTPKGEYVGAGADDVLFDDEARNREAWQGTAYDVENLVKILKEILKNA